MKKISLIVFDRKGGDYADLPDLLGQEWLHLSFHHGLRLGLQAPEGVLPNVWTNIVATLLASNAGLIAAWTTFASLMRWLLGVLNATGPISQPLWPDLRLVLDVLHASPDSLWSAKIDYSRALAQPLTGAVQAGGEFLQAFVGLDIERHIINPGKSVVISMENLYPPWLRLFVVNLFVCQVLLARIHRNHRVDTTEVVFVIDECDPDVSRQAEAAFPNGISPIGQLLKQGREFGIMALLGMTSLGQTSRFVLANAQYHLIHNMSDDESVFEAKRTLMLPSNAALQIPALRNGECFIREAQSAWVHPMWCKVDYVPPCRTPLRENYDSHPFIPSKPLSELPAVQDALRQLIAEHNKRKLAKKRAASGLTEKTRELLELASLLLFVPVARLWDQLGKPSFNIQSRTRKELEHKSLASFADLRIGKRNQLLVEITEKGWKLLGKPCPKRKGRGGIAHAHFCAWLCVLGEKLGYKVKTEFIVPGTNHPADVVWMKSGQIHAFEVVVDCLDNILSHLDACLIRSDVIRTVTIIAAQKNMLQELQRTIRQEITLIPYIDRIRFEDVENFLIKELWP